MGTDMRLFAEKRVDGVWIHAQDDSVVPDDSACGRSSRIPYGKGIYETRDYELFIILGCRGLGFRCGDIEPIDAYRGLPKGLSPFVKSQAEYDEGQCMAHNWFLLREIEEFDWRNHKVNFTGFVTPEKAKRFRDEGIFPDEISHGDFGVGEKIEWSETYEEIARNFLAIAVPKLESFGHPDNVRIILWFDP